MVSVLQPYRREIISCAFAAAAFVRRCSNQVYINLCDAYEKEKVDFLHTL